MAQKQGIAGENIGKNEGDGAGIRVVLCTSGGVLGAIVLGSLMRDPGFRVTGVVRSVRVFRPDYGFLKGAVHFFIRCGIPYTVYIWLITTAAEAIGCVLGRESCSVGAIARRAGIPVFKTRDINSGKSHAFLKSIQPQLLISAHFDQKLESDLCDGAAFAAVNLHPSLLPKHRGVEPVFQAFLAGETQLGVSLHRLSETIDSGKILEQVTISRDARWSVFGASCQLMITGAELLLSNKEKLLDAGSGFFHSEGGSYESWPHPREVWRLYGRGMQLISWRDLRLLKI
jgi:methionyl-tRNA formyltransferase